MKKKVIIIEELAKMVLEKAEEKHRIALGIGIYKEADIRSQLASYLYEKKLTNSVLKIETFYKGIITNKIEQSLHSKPFLLFKALTKYLTIDNPEKEDVEYDLRKVLKQLVEKGIITKELADLQLEKLEKEEGDKWSFYYILYFAKEDLTPGKSLLKIDSEFERAEIDFFDDEKTRFIGDVNLKSDRNNLTLRFKDPITDLPSFIIVKQKNSEKIQNTNRLDGYFLSVLRKDNWNPAAGRVILEKISSEEDYKSNSEIRDEIKIEIGSREKIKQSLLLESIKKYVGSYVGYWFLIKTNQEIIKIAFEIKADGTVIFREKGIKDQKGIVYQIDEMHEVIRIQFDLIEDHSYRIQMIFQIKENEVSFFDGIYSGQRYHHSKIMGGKIRIYKTDLKNDEIEPENIPFDDAKKILGAEKATSLINFFWGTQEENGSIVFPNISNFEKLGKQRIASEKIIDRKILNLTGYYSLYKLDSSKNKINQYNLYISNDGTVLYHGTQDNYKVEFKGTISFKKNSCIVLEITSKDADETYFASYIFWIGGHNRDDFTCLTGTYNTIAKCDIAPICGRAVLLKEAESTNLKTININSEEFFSIKHNNNQKKEIFNLLTGSENNQIKTKREKDALDRKINYGKVFFGDACYGKKNTQERLVLLKHALDHNFSDITLLEQELSQNLKSINNEVEIKKFEDRTVIIIKADCLKDLPCIYTVVN